MASTKKQTGVLYIDSNSVFFYAASIGNTIEISFSPDVVSDLDLVSSEKFEQMINAFVQNSLKEQEFEVILVFSHNAAFEKDVVLNDLEDVETQTQSFIDIIPFEEVLSKVYKLNKKTKIVGVNKVFYDLLKEVFEKNKSTISMVLPLSVLQEVDTNLLAKMDLGEIAIKAYSFKQFNMIEKAYNPLGDEQKTEDSKKPKRKFHILVGTFVVLLLVLVIFAYKTLFSKPTPKQSPVVLPAFTPVPTVQIENVSPVNNSTTITPTNTQ